METKAWSKFKKMVESVQISQIIFYTVDIQHHQQLSPFLQNIPHILIMRLLVHMFKSITMVGVYLLFFYNYIIHVSKFHPENSQL